MAEEERHGKLMLTTALSSILIWLFLSDGYNPAVNFLSNLYYRMYVYDGTLVCEATRFFLPIDQSGQCWVLTIWTKYLVLISCLFAIYGFVIWKQLLPDPIPVILRKIKAHFESPPLDEWPSNKDK